MSEQERRHHHHRRHHLHHHHGSHGSGPTYTVQPVFSGLVACVADTLVPAHHVDTLTVPAQPVAELTLVYI